MSIQHCYGVNRATGTRRQTMPPVEPTWSWLISGNCWASAGSFPSGLLKSARWPKLWSFLSGKLHVCPVCMPLTWRAAAEWIQQGGHQRKTEWCTGMAVRHLNHEEVRPVLSLGGQFSEARGLILVSLCNMVSLRCRHGMQTFPKSCGSLSWDTSQPCCRACTAACADSGAIWLRRTRL